MNGQTTTAKSYGKPISAILTVFFLVFASGTTVAQVPVDEDGNTLPAYSTDELDSSVSKPVPAAGAALSSTDLEDLVGPIALYPDDLLAIVLPASTYPLEIVQAARFLERLESDSTLKPDEAWDDSIVALLNYPEVVRMMDEDIDWTWRLGEAVISQQNEVIAAVEAFRDRAYAAGNLKSDENQTVTSAEGIIEIVPVNEEIIYVPYYEPAEVVVYQPRPVYHYYPMAYPSYYYPYPLGYSFASGYFWGVTTAYSIGWNSHYLHVYHPTYWGHPYYGHSYYSHYYRSPSIGIYNNWYVNNSYRTSSYSHRDGDYWRPRIRAGSRQDEPRVRNYYYPPGGDQRRREDYSARNQMNNRDNGRLSLGLRERSESDRNRVATVNRDNRGRATISGNNNVRNNNARATSSNRINADAGGISQGNRAAVNNGATPRVNGGDTRDRVAANNPRTSQNLVRNSGPRPEIQFRDRGSENQSLSSRNSARSSGNINSSRPSQNQAGSSFAPRQSTNGNTSSSRTSRPGTTQQRVTAPRASTPTFRQRAPSTATAPRSSAPRASAPSVRQSAPAPRASAPRTSAPRTSAPRASAPRTSAPRSSAPRASAPRASAPRSSAPRSSAPRVSSGSSARSSAPRSSGSSRSSSSSRPRNRSN